MAPQFSANIFVQPRWRRLEYTYILDTDSRRLCSLNFGRWARGTAHWSRNGRYLAIIRAQGRIPIQSSDVAMLDTATGHYYMFRTTDLEIKEGFVQDISWSPDNRHLLFNVKTAYSQSTYTYSGALYIGDFISGQTVRVLPSFQLNISADEKPNLAWSPDGSKLLMNCSTTEGSKRVCLIHVQASGK
jgi:Tol biopolymer transport system component